MKSFTAIYSWGLVPFGVLVYVLDKFVAPRYGMGPATICSAVLVLLLIVIAHVTSKKEQDERERLLLLQSDSTALYTVIAGLLAETIFYPHSELAMMFWIVVGLATLSRAIAFLYYHK